MNVEHGKWVAFHVSMPWKLLCIWWWNLHNFLTRAWHGPHILLTYNCMIHPIFDELAWPEVEMDIVQPPKILRDLGGQRWQRWGTPSKPSINLKSFVTLRCGICNVIGHNKRICPKALATAKRLRSMHITLIVRNLFFFIQIDQST